MGLAVKPTRREMLAIFVQGIITKHNEQAAKLTVQRSEISREISEVDNESRAVLDKFIEDKYRKTLTKATAILRKEFPGITLTAYWDSDSASKFRSGVGDQPISEIKVWLHTRFDNHEKIELDEEVIATLYEHNVKRQELNKAYTDLTVKENELRANRPDYDSCLMKAMTMLGDDAKEHLDALSEMLSKILDKELLPNAPAGSEKRLMNT